jgi:amino acid transporter
MCLVIDLGGAPDHDRRGFRYWRENPFNNTFFNVVPASKARFLGFWAVLTQAAFSCMFRIILIALTSLILFSDGGMEGLAMICLEASNPRVTMKTAVRAIFYRIVLLCMLHSFDANVVLTQPATLDVFAILLMGMCLARDNDHLLQANADDSGTAAQSPFVIIIQTSGIKVLDHIISKWLFMSLHLMSY